MKIKVINPNTTQSMTRLIERSLFTYAVEIDLQVVSPSMGPASIESHYDEALSVPGLLAEIKSGLDWGADAFVVACFGDPGIEAAREISPVPVIGIAEGAFHVASLLGGKFSIVTTLARTIGRAEYLLHETGLGARCAGAHACDIAVLDLEKPESNALETIIEASRAALAADESHAVVLGCAGMAEYVDEVSAAIGAPVVDGVSAALLLAKTLVSLGLRPAKKGEQDFPPAKRYTGLLKDFAV
ncbi:aspartate/glutamate racemase family protein [Rothia aerolata]|uniref:Asp/Glu racemase n=1 Tax=Rothia aerolata TaxID=1812262 RepID=A0A917MV06_9MICC|nr:aspartate/glutamate racemase family protein [Rothia aerolata]GGH65814.1 putative Asp/Glu racemase [Rothia aerolata]